MYLISVCRNAYEIISFVFLKEYSHLSGLDTIHLSPVKELLKNKYDYGKLKFVAAFLNHR